MSYNAENRRVQKQIAATTSTKIVWEPTTDAYFSELDNSNTNQKLYTFEPVQYGNLISQRVGGDSYIHADALGSSRALSSTGTTVTDTFLYDAWGNEVARTGTTAIVPFRWVGGVGYYYDTETGLYYVRARVYQPTIARWCSVDPLGFPNGINRISYAQSDPISLVDESGLICAPCCCCAEGIRGAFNKDENPSTINPKLGVGTYFELFVDIQLRPSQESTPCLLEYWEWASPNDGERGRTNCWRNNLEGQQEKTNKKTIDWCNLTKPGEARPTDADWCKFVHPSEFPKKKCPSSLSIPLQDTPTIKKTANNSRNLDFHVVVKSAPECQCWNEEVVWEGCQLIELDHGGNILKKVLHADASKCDNFPKFKQEDMC